MEFQTWHAHLSDLELASLYDFWFAGLEVAISDLQTTYGVPLSELLKWLAKYHFRLFF